jgi:hypothetical protein
MNSRDSDRKSIVTTRSCGPVTWRGGRVNPPHVVLGICFTAALLLAELSVAAAPQSSAPPEPAQQQANDDQVLEEIVVEGRRALRKPQAILDWMARIVGQFTVTGNVDLRGHSGTDLLDAQGRSTCVGLGPGPAVQCELSIRWPEARGIDGEKIVGGVSTLDPAMMVFGFEPNRIGIRHMLVGNDGIADGAMGYLLSGDTLVTRAKCGGVAGTCERMVQVTAEPDAQTVRVRIEMQIDLRKAVTIAFDMHRVPGSPSRVYPGSR